MLVLMCTPPPPKIQSKENKRTQRLKKIWKIQKQLKKEEKNLFRELWEGCVVDAPQKYDFDFEDIFDTF